MQTLRTAAIVVLLMTIIYGAYVSLTTPTEPLPPEVADMLVMGGDGEFTVESGLPDSLGELSISTGDAEMAASAGPSLGTPIVSSDTGIPGLEVSIGASEAPVTGTLTDSSDSLEGGVAAEPEMIAGYPTTGKTFSLPSPGGLDVTFQTASSVKSSLGSTPPEPSASLGQPNAIPSPEWDSSPSVADSAAAARLHVGVSNAIKTADRQYGEKKLKEALATLSLFYNTPNLSGEQRSELLSRLDPLAREVIYSKRHLFEQPYRVGQNETLMEVASRFEVPWQLLANINQVEDPVTVLPGTELKVVRGPFRADVDLVTKELTLFLGDLYAGRFPVEIGADPSPKPGTFTVQDKQTQHTFYDASGSPVPAGSPDNPYGNAWLDLGGQLCIHGSPSTTTATDQGCISLAGDYADDLYGILSQGSTVTIRR